MFNSTAHIRSDELPKPPHSIDGLTSALDYKTSHKVKPPPLPKMDLPRSRSSEEAVMNILYNTPPLNLTPSKRKPPPLFFFLPLGCSSSNGHHCHDYATTATTDCDLDCDNGNTSLAAPALACPRPPMGTLAAARHACALMPSVGPSRCGK